MRNFRDLLDPTGEVFPKTIQGVRDMQLSAQAEFPALLHEHGLLIRKPDGAIPDLGTLLVIGVGAAYSTIDLEFLDEVWEAMAAKDLDRVEIFDVSPIRSPEALEAFIPGIMPAYHTPVVGLWDNGILEVCLWGYDAREFVKKRYLGNEQ